MIPHATNIPDSFLGPDVPLLFRNTLPHVIRQENVKNAPGVRLGI